MRINSTKNKLNKINSIKKNRLTLQINYRRSQINK